MSYRIICQRWMEFESGFGSRPDGYSLHLNETDLIAFILKQSKENPTEPLTTGQCVSKPYENPIYDFEVDNDTYKKIVAANMTDTKGIWGNPTSWPKINNN